MRDVIVAANWKMHTTPAEAAELAATIASRTREPDVTRVICPPFVSLAAVRDALAASDPDVGIGAQNVHHEAAGAYTGEISAPMLAGLATWVIVGHSERRRDFGETDERIGQKLGRATDAGLRAILCVGERAEERDAGEAESVVETQLRGALAGHDPAVAVRGRPGRRLRTGVGDRHRPDGPRVGRGRDGRRDPRDPGRAGVGECRRRPPDPVRRQRHGREHRRLPRRAQPSTARSSAGHRSSPMRWPGSWPGPG